VRQRPMSNLAETVATKAAAMAEKAKNLMRSEKSAILVKNFNIIYNSLDPVINYSY